MEIQPLYLPPPVCYGPAHGPAVYHHGCGRRYNAVGRQRAGQLCGCAITAAGKTQNLLSCALESIGTAMATYAGQNLGAARLDRVRSGVKSSYIMVVAYSVLAFIALHFGDVVIIGLFLDTKTEVEIVAMARDYMFWNSLFFIPLGALIVWRYTIQGLGYSTLAMMAGVAEMVARTVIALVLIPVLGYFGAELANPAAWVAACLFLYRLTCGRSNIWKTACLPATLPCSTAR